LALAGTTVYFTALNSSGVGMVASVPAAGGDISIIESGLASPGSVATDGTAICWAIAGAQPTAGEIHCRSVSGSTLYVVATGELNPRGLAALNGRDLYFVTGGTSSGLVKTTYTYTTSTSRMIAIAAAPIDNFVLDPNSGPGGVRYGYYTLGGNEIWKVAVNAVTSTPGLVVSNSGSVGPMALDPTSLYWYWSAVSPGIYRMPKLAVATSDSAL
jgi:hypothetical protein